MSPGLYLRMIWRESRGSHARLIFLIACVAVGVAAVVGVASLSETVEQGLRARSRDLLGGDLSLQARRPLPDVADYLPAEYAGDRVRRVDVRVLSTMLRNADGESTLVEVKAIGPDPGLYPLSGALVTDPAAPLDELLTDDTVLVAPELQKQLGLSRGSRVSIGGRAFRVSGWILEEPDPLNFSLSFGARVLMTRGALEQTALLGFGSRVRYRTILGFEPELDLARLAALKQHLVERVPGGGAHVAIETHDEGQPALRGALRRVRQYMGLVALLSLLVASVGVAQIVGTWLSQAAPATAILRCLGLRPREVFVLHLGHLVALAALGSALGALIGSLAPLALVHSRPDLFPDGVAGGLSWWPAVHGVLLGVSVCVLFSLGPLTSVFRVPPARVLRSEAHSLPAPRLVRLSTLVLALLAAFAAAFLQSRDAKVAAAFTAGLALLTLVLWLSTRALLWLVSRVPRERLSPLIWQGAAALTRPGSGVTGSILALGLGTMVVLGIALVQELLGRQLHTVLPEDAPSVFLVDVQPDQWPGVQQLARQAGATHLRSAPVAMGRLQAVDGRSVEELLAEQMGERNERTRARWVLTREQRVTWRERLPPDNTITAGALWSDPEADEVSVEEGFAEDMGAGLGSVLRFDVQGVPLELKVTSLRTVQWRSFSMNFFMVVEPGVLEEAPHFVLGGVRLPPEAEQPFQDRLAAAHPNVTMLRVRDVIRRVSGLLEQGALAVRSLGSFAVLTGLITLVGAVASSQLRRQREAALLKTLGLTRRSVRAMFAIEYALTGAVAGLVGAIGAYVLAAQFGQRVLEVDSGPSLWLCGIAVLVTVALSVVSGLLASARALRVPPLQVFRQQEG